MWEDAIQRLKQKRKTALSGGGVRKIEKQHSAGKQTARERLSLLFDDGSFTELNAFYEPATEDNSLNGDGVITAYGKINGRLAAVAAQDFTVKGGTAGAIHAKKICRILDLALDMKIPFISINDSGGARIEEGIASLNGYAEIFARHVKASGIIPQIAVIMGPCSGGACYSPALCDFIFMTENTGQMFITGPKVVKAATGEETTPDELGGAVMHGQLSGVAHFIHKSEEECLNNVKRLLSYLGGFEKAKENSADNTEILPLIPENLRRPYDMHKVIDCISDKDSFMEVQESYMKNGITGFARMNGDTVGIVANQPAYMGGALDYNVSDKLARFVRFCDCFNIPVITLVDVPAFYPGRQQEQAGIIRHGAKLLYAYAEASVPKVTVIIRKAYGGAYIAMGSKGLGADIVYALPIAEIAVMGAEGAVSILSGKSLSEAKEPDKERRRLEEEYKIKYLNPFCAASQGLVDEVIMPGEIREKLLSALLLLKNKKKMHSENIHGNIPL